LGDGFISVADFSLFVWLVADDWCWFVLREEYCWLVAGDWFVLREKYSCWWLISLANGVVTCVTIFFAGSLLALSFDVSCGTSLRHFVESLLGTTRCWRNVGRVFLFTFHFLVRLIGDSSEIIWS
jgi:hypothetical protein